MGITLNKPHILSTSLRAQDYEVLEWSPSPQQHPTTGGRVLKNRLTGTEIQQYHIRLSSSQQFQTYCNFYHWRLSQQHVVRTLFLMNESSGSLCSTSYFVRLYTERIPIKLVQIVDIPYPDNMYVMISALDGFSKIVEQTGYFDVHQNMIGINKQGQIKIWLNDDLSKNYPDLGFNEKYRKVMVQKIIQIIDANTDHSSQPASLKKFLFDNMKIFSFNQAMLLVRQFSKMYKTQIPSTFESILQLLNNPHCINELDFELTRSNMLSNQINSLPFYQMKDSQMSVFGKLQHSLKIPKIQNRLANKSSTHNNSNKMGINNSPNISNIIHPIIHPSSIAQSIPISQFPQKQGQISHILQHHSKQNFQRPVQSNNFENQNTLRSIIRNTTQLKHSHLIPKIIHPPLNRESIMLRQKSRNHSEVSRQSANSRPLKDSNLIINQNPIKKDVIRFVDVTDSSLDSFAFDRQTQQQQQIQSAYFQDKFKTNKNSNIGYFRQKSPLSHSKINDVCISYYSPMAVHQMDPDIARDLMQLGDD